MIKYVIWLQFANCYYSINSLKLRLHIVALINQLTQLIYSVNASHSIPYTLATILNDNSVPGIEYNIRKLNNNWLIGQLKVDTS